MEPITVTTTINTPIQTVWDAWTMPEHITKWTFASPDWHAPSVTNDLQVGGKFTTRMEAVDGSVGFDFGGMYSNIEQNKKIQYVMDDGRNVSILFDETPEGVVVTETFDPESMNSAEMQRAGWQAILDNFKKYAESL